MLHCKPMWYYKTKHNHSILFLRCGALLNTLKGLRSLILHQALFFPPFSSLLKYLSVNFFIGYFWLCVSIKLKQSGQYRWLVGNRYLWPSLLKKKTKPHESQLGGSFPPWHFELAIWFFSVASTEIQQPEHFNSLWGSFFFFFSLQIQQSALTWKGKMLSALFKLSSIQDLGAKAELGRAYFCSWIWLLAKFFFKGEMEFKGVMPPFSPRRWSRPWEPPQPP